MSLRIRSAEFCGSCVPDSEHPGGWIIRGYGIGRAVVTPATGDTEVGSGGGDHRSLAIWICALIEDTDHELNQVMEGFDLTVQIRNDTGQTVFDGKVTSPWLGKKQPRVPWPLATQLVFQIRILGVQPGTHVASFTLLDENGQADETTRKLSVAFSP